jgi:hypothetical protein
MERKDYERPTVRVVEIQQRGLLMTSGTSGGLGNRGDYTTDDTNPFGSSASRGMGSVWDDN